MKQLWTKEKEIEFFTESRKFASPERLFYVSKDKKYYAYWLKTYKGVKTTLQSRNSLIGSFTEKYSFAEGDTLTSGLIKIQDWNTSGIVSGIILSELQPTKNLKPDLPARKVFWYNFNN